MTPKVGRFLLYFERRMQTSGRVQAEHGRQAGDGEGEQGRNHQPRSKIGDLGQEAKRPQNQTD